MPLLADDKNGVPLDSWDANLFAYFCMRESEVGGKLTCVLFFLIILDLDKFVQIEAI